MVEFTNYHQRYIAAWKILFAAAKWDADAPKTVVEVGSYEGSSAWWIIHNLLKSSASRLYCIDAWAEEGAEERYHRFLRTVAELPNPDRIEILRGWSHEHLRELLHRGIRADLLYVDGGHDAPTVLRDLVTGFDLGPVDNWGISSATEA